MGDNQTIDPVVKTGAGEEDVLLSPIFNSEAKRAKNAGKSATILDSRLQFSVAHLQLGNKSKVGCINSDTLNYLAESVVSPSPISGDQDDLLYPMNPAEPDISATSKSHVMPSSSLYQVDEYNDGQFSDTQIGEMWFQGMPHHGNYSDDNALFQFIPNASDSGSFGCLGKVFFLSPE